MINFMRLFRLFGYGTSIGALANRDSDMSHSGGPQPWWFLLPIALFAGWSIFIEREFFADFGYMFIRVLESGQIYDFGLTNRVANAVLSQLPLVIALHWGVQDFDMLKLLYGLSFYGSHVILLIIAYLVSYDRRDAIFPILSFLSFSLFIQFFSTEALFAVEFAWILGLVLIPVRETSITLKVISILAACGLMLSYETSIAFAVVAFVALFLRASAFKDREEFIYHSIIAIVLLIGIAFQAKGIIYPYAPQNITTFTAFFEVILNNSFLIVIPIIYASSLIYGLFFKEVDIKISIFATLFGSIVYFALYFYAESIFDGVPKDEYPLRAIVSFGGFGVYLIYAVYDRIRLLRGLIFRMALLSSCFLIGFQVPYQFNIGLGWIEYLSRLKDVVANGSPAVSSLVQTKLFDSDIKSYNWTWTMPALSIIEAPHGQVNSLVEYCYNGWRPISILSPPDLGRFGIEYSYLDKFARREQISIGDIGLERKQGKGVLGEVWSAQNLTIPDGGINISFDPPIAVAPDHVELDAHPYDSFLLRFVSGNQVQWAMEKGPGELSSHYSINTDPGGPIDMVVVDRICGERGFHIGMIRFGENAPLAHSNSGFGN